MLLRWTGLKGKCCALVVSNLDWQKRRTLSESPSQKLRRQASSSRAKLTHNYVISKPNLKENRVHWQKETMTK